jgi:hypothetical protein
MSVRRVEQLIALATDQAATEEEARTAAIAACREIRREGYVVQGSRALPSSPRREPVEQHSAAARARSIPVLPGSRELPAAALDSPKAHIVNFEFRDSGTEEGFAFSPTLLRGVLRGGG